MSRSASPRQTQKALPILAAEDFPLPETKPEPQPDAFPAPPEAPEVIELDEAPMALVQVAPRPMAQNPAQAATPMMLLQIAVERGDDLARIQGFMDMQDRWEASQARKAFNQAFADFKSEAIQIVKNIDVKDGPLKGKKYADLFAVVNAVTPALSKYGLSHSWRLTKDEKDWIEVICTIRHALGHSESVFMGGPPDVGGAKNAIQARGSSKSYLERYTLLAITGLAASNQDNDGAGAPVVESDLFPEAVFQSHLAAIRESADDKILEEKYLAAIRACPEKATSSLQAIKGAKNDRYRELHPKTGGGR